MSVGFDLPAARSIVAHAVQARGRYVVARELAMSVPGLNKFLAGSRPIGRTRAKLARWLTRHASELPQALAAAAALELVMADLDPAVRGMVAESIRAVHQAALHGTPWPDTPDLPPAPAGAGPTWGAKHELVAHALLVDAGFSPDSHTDGVARIRASMEALWKEAHGAR